MTENVLYNFRGSSDGYSPNSNLVTSDGNLFYGTMSSGGIYNLGTVYSINKSTSKLTTLDSFTDANGANPKAGLVLYNGILYGTAYNGGINGYGTVFSIPIATGSTISVLDSFTGTNGANPQAGLVLSSDNTKLYGTTYNGGTNGYGTVFSIPIAGGTGTITVLDSFAGTNGANPQAGLVLSNNILYGTASADGAYGYGTVFSIPIAGGAGTISVLDSFTNTNGANPQAGLVLYNGILYGTAYNGGANFGTVFSISTGSKITVLDSFTNTNGANPVAGLILSSDNTKLYGTTYNGGVDGKGTVFSIPIEGDTITVLDSFNGDNGANPKAGLVLSNNILYGTAFYKGENSGAKNGSIFFSIPAAGGTISVLITSIASDNAYNPFSNLITSDGITFYGTTYNGGTYGVGTVYSINKNTNTITVLDSFTGTNGANPTAGLVLYNGILYGTTNNGGSQIGSTEGTVFSISIAGGEGSIILLANFDVLNGANPVAGLILSSDNTKLYGTATAGGVDGKGTVFSIPIEGDTITALDSFINTNGANPGAGLILYNNILYGTTYNGGTNEKGTVFSISTATGSTISVLDSFTGSNGANPQVGLVLSNNILYGTTVFGGEKGYGTVFSIPIGGGIGSKITVLDSFTNTNGANPVAGLILSSDNTKLYGTTYNGGTNVKGTVFSIPIAGGTDTITVLNSFTGSNGANPQVGLVLSNNILYGTTSSGGTYNLGTVFNISPTNVNLPIGWSMIGTSSISFISANTAINVVYKFSNNAYAQVNPDTQGIYSLSANTGYWINCTSSTTITIETSDTNNSFPLLAGWSMIGSSFNCDIETNTAISVVYEFSNNAYAQVNPDLQGKYSLSANKGYWINCTSPTTINYTE